MNAEAIVSLVFGVLALCGTVIGCTWALCDKLGKLVTQNQCSERRTSCPCVIEIKNLKERFGK